MSSEMIKQCCRGGLIVKAGPARMGVMFEGNNDAGFGAGHLNGDEMRMIVIVI